MRERKRKRKRKRKMERKRERKRKRKRRERGKEHVRREKSGFLWHINCSCNGEKSAAAQAACQAAVHRARVVRVGRHRCG